MSEYRTNNKDVTVNSIPINAIPLFASSWLALFSVLRDNYYESRSLPNLDHGLPLAKADKTESNVND